MTTTTTTGKKGSVHDLEVLEEIALAMAQAEIADAIAECGLKKADIAEKAGWPQSFISKVLRGSHNLTIRTMARLLGAAGFEARFSRAPIAVTWSTDMKPIVTETASPIGDASGFTMTVVSSDAFPIHELAA